MALATSYSPAQQRVIDVLGSQAGAAPAIGPAFVADLRAELEERLAPVAEALAAPEPGRADETRAELWIGKSQLAAITSCEARWRAERERPFEWSVPTARGTVAHKAISLQVNWRGEAAPEHMVDEALGRLVEDEHSRLGEYLRCLSTVELAELRGDAIAFVTAFEECFPPIRARWRPVLDGSLRASFAGDRVHLTGKPDLTLGSATHTGKVIIDLKTGRHAIHHLDDLRFYALVDALRVGVPPRRVASVYLDSGEPVVETVTEGVLEAALERVVRSAEAMTEVRTGQREATRRPGKMCRWCPALGSCVPGQEEVAAQDAAAADGW